METMFLQTKHLHITTILIAVMNNAKANWMFIVALHISFFMSGTKCHLTVSFWTK